MRKFIFSTSVLITGLYVFFTYFGVVVPEDHVGIVGTIAPGGAYSSLSDVPRSPGWRLVLPGLQKITFIETKQQSFTISEDVRTQEGLIRLTAEIAFKIKEEQAVRLVRWDYPDYKNSLITISERELKGVLRNFKSKDIYRNDLPSIEASVRDEIVFWVRDRITIVRVSITGIRVSE